jgi:hypothetical protein
MSDQARAQLAVLASAESAVELGPVGVAAVVTDACRAYRALAQDRDAVARLEPELVAMTREGSPAAIIYAALLLRGAGRDVTPLLAPHADDRRPCTVFPGGCTGMTHWLCEATRWAASGQHWSHPERILAHELDNLQLARWFELPSAEVLEAARGQLRRDGRLAVGNWTFTFAELFVSRGRIGMARARLAELLAHRAPAVRLYAALLVREVDRAAGERALAVLAASTDQVERLSPTRFRPQRTRLEPIAAIAKELASWPEGTRR